MAAAKFEVYTGVGAKVHFRILDSKGDVVATSDGFQHKDAAMERIRDVKEHSKALGLIAKKDLGDGKSGFVLKSPSHKIVLQGGPYADVEACENAINTVKMTSQAAIIDKA
jgi:uncharacterized protein YegP (UPF0339 family)